MKIYFIRKGKDGTISKKEYIFGTSGIKVSNVEFS